jgi:hypothetical protein
MSEGKPTKEGRVLLLSGVPAAGKSYFGQWLESNEGFLHFDVENDDHLDQHLLKHLWDESFVPGDGAARFVDALRHLSCPVVLDWGFPPSWLDVVAMLKTAGVQIWWFDADQEAARKAYIARGDRPIECFERQIAKISRHWAEIRAVFEPQLIPTLKPNGDRMPPEHIWRLVKGTARSGRYKT